MLVVAFDGILVDTLEFRATAIVDALAAEGVVTNVRTVLFIVPSLSLPEAIRIAAKADHVDETTLDLAVLRAERLIGDLGARGATLNLAVCDRLRRAAAVTRIVVRADSRRREVEPLIALAELDSVVSFVRCSDDASVPNTNDTKGVASPLHAPEAQPSSLERSYAHITRRLYGNRSLLGTSAEIGIALELGDVGRTVARSHGFVTPENFDAANLPRH
ncbi:MAG: hypothetical protein ABJB74_07245 [Gemmatimonas sp.]